MSDTTEILWRHELRLTSEDKNQCCDDSHIWQYFGISVFLVLDEFENLKLDLLVFGFL